MYCATAGEHCEVGDNITDVVGDPHEIAFAYPLDRRAVLIVALVFWLAVSWVDREIAVRQDQRDLLQNEINAMRETEGLKIKFTQCRQKDGSLRFCFAGQPGSASVWY